MPRSGSVRRVAIAHSRRPASPDRERRMTDSDVF